MIEVIVKNYLEEALDIPVYLEMPENKPEKFLIIEKTGSGIEDKINSAIMAIQSYAPSLFECATLNEEVKTALFKGYIPRILGCELNSDYNFTNPQTKEYRYQAVYEFYY